MIRRFWNWLRKEWEVAAKQASCDHKLTLENDFICPHCDFDLVDR